MAVMLVLSEYFPAPAGENIHAQSKLIQHQTLLYTCSYAYQITPQMVGERGPPFPLQIRALLQGRLSTDRAYSKNNPPQYLGPHPRLCININATKSLGLKGKV